MSALDPAIHPDTDLRPAMERLQRNALLLGLLGIVAMVVGFVIDRDQFFRSYLFGFLFWNGLAVGSLGIFLMHNVVGGNWGIVIRRFLEAGARTLPLMFVLIIPILLGIHSLYIWSHADVIAHDENIRHKTPYLNATFFIGRAVFYFVVWILFTMRLTRLSAEQDRTGDPMVQERMRMFSAPALLFFVITATFAFIDWIMSLEPHWYSTIYGAMFLIGQVLETLCFAVAVLIILAPRKPFRDVLRLQHFHDLGNLMLAFTMLWAYLSLSQFLIIWSANLPEEIPWYLTRFNKGWGVIAVLLSFCHFIIPFLLLLQRRVKKDPRLLYFVALWLIVIRMVDIYWIVEPSFYPKGLAIHWMDIAAPIGIGGLWLAFFVWHLKARPLLPLRDRRLGYHPVEEQV